MKSESPSKKRCCLLDNSFFKISNEIIKIKENLLKDVSFYLNEEARATFEEPTKIINSIPLFKLNKSFFQKNYSHFFIFYCIYILCEISNSFVNGQLFILENDGYSYEF